MGIFSFSAIVSCNDRNQDVVIPEPITAVMTDVTGTLNLSNNFTINQGINLNQTDVVLVYRYVVSTINTVPSMWQLIPKTEFIGGGRELDYNFKFNTQNVKIYTEANFDQSTLPSGEAADYLVNQRFRIVLIPAVQGKNAQVDYRDYKSVLKFYNIPDRD